MALLDSFFGNQTPLGPRPKWETYDVHGPNLSDPPDGKLQEDEDRAHKLVVIQWEELKSNKAARDTMYSKMAQKVGPTPAPFKTRMGTKEAPPNMMASLFPSKFYAAGAGPVDIVAPEVGSIEDIYRKKDNMFRMV